MKVLIVLLAVILSFVAVGAASYITAYNFGNRAEKNIAAAYEDNKNVLSQYTLKVAEAAQVPAMQRDDLTRVIQAALTARYGEQGSKAAWSWIQEQNPQINSEVYIRIQQIIEAGRTEFRVAQTRLIDLKRVYETGLGSFWRGLWLRIAGYPKVDLSKFNIVLSSDAEKAFETGKQDPLKLR